MSLWRPASWALGLWVVGLAACKPKLETAGAPVQIDDGVFLRLDASDGPASDGDPPIGVHADVHDDAIYVQRGIELLVISRTDGAPRSLWFDEPRLLIPGAPEGLLVWQLGANNGGEQDLQRVHAARTSAPNDDWMVFEYRAEDAVHEPVIVGDRIALVSAGGIVHAPLEPGAAGAAGAESGLQPGVLAIAHPPAVPVRTQTFAQGSRLRWLARDDGHDFVLSTDPSFEAIRVDHEQEGDARRLLDAAAVGDQLVLASITVGGEFEELIIERRGAGGELEQLRRVPHHEDANVGLVSDGALAWLRVEDQLWRVDARGHAQVLPFVAAPETGPLALGLDGGVLLWTTARPGGVDFHVGLRLANEAPHRGIRPTLSRDPTPGDPFCVTGEDDDVWGGLASAGLVGGHGGAVGLESGSAPAPTGPVPRVRQAKAIVDGPLERDIVRRIVRAHINEIRACYLAGLEDDPKLEGRVVIDFVITAKGETRDVEDATGELPDGSDPAALPHAKVRECIANYARKWRFPKPPGGGLVRVSYPFNLEPG